MNRQRVVIVLTTDMHEAIKRQAAERGATQSGLIRAVLGAWLREQGEVIDWHVEWGGRREKPEEAED